MQLAINAAQCGLVLAPEVHWLLPWTRCTFLHYTSIEDKPEARSEPTRCPCCPCVGVLCSCSMTLTLILFVFIRLIEQST